MQRNPTPELQIHSICVTFNNVSDASVLPDLLQRLSEDEALESVIGDGAGDTLPVYEAVIKRGAIPIITPRKNAQIRKGSVFEHRNAAIYCCMHALGAKYLETLEWLPPVQLGGNQDELHQTAGRACDVPHL